MTHRLPCAGPGLVAILHALLVFPTAWAKVIYVDSALATGANDGSEWADAYKSLQNAIFAADPGDEIWVARGIYYPDEGEKVTADDAAASFTIDKDISIYGGFLNGDKFSSDRDPEMNLTVLSGDITQNDGGDPDGDGVPNNINSLIGTNSSRIVTVNQVASGSTFDGFTITSGNGTSGCGMHITDSSLTVNACRIVFNKATGNGGGVHISGDGMKFTRSIIDRNQANRGGGVYLDAADVSFADMFMRSNAATNQGGGIYAFQSVLSLARTDAAFNTAGFNGGGFFLETSTQRAVTVTDCRFQSNSCNGTGGAFHLQNALINVTGCEFRGNTASPATGFGGAMHFESSNAVFVNSLFSGNTAGLSGGGLRGLSSTATVTNCTFANNQANTLAAYAGTGNFINSIFWDNTTLSPTSSDVGTANSFSHCLVEGQDLSASGNNLDGTLAASDPLFEIPVTAAPSRDGNYRLLVGSPCLDRGDSAAYSGPAEDLQGEERFHDYNRDTIRQIDLGPYESQALAVVTNPDADSDGLPDSYETAHTEPPSITSLAPGGDPDRDKIPTIVEFALGGSFDPTVFNLSPLSITVDAMDRPVITHPRSVSALEFVTLSLESSTDLGNADDWGAAPVTTSATPPSGGIQTVIHTATHTTTVEKTHYRLSAVKK